MTKEEIPERNFISSPKPLKNKQTIVIVNQTKKSLCKIITKNFNASGFLANIPNPVLITTNSVLGEQELEIGQKIKLSFNDDETLKSILIEKNRNIYTINKKDDVTLDISIIQIKPIEDELSDQEFLQLDNDLLKNDLKEKYESQNIYMIQYSNGEDSVNSTGVISEIIKNKYNYDIIHTCDTDIGSYGSPILLYNHKVIGVHRGECGTLLKYPIMEYLKLFGVKKEKNINDDKNEIIINVKIKEKDVGKNIYFLDNTDDDDYFYENGKDVTKPHDNLKELNTNNTLLFINNKQEEYKKFFVPESAGSYEIKLKFNIKISNCRYMFYGCINLINIDLSNFNTQNVNNMAWMFGYCVNLTNINLTSFNTQNVKNMRGMFCRCEYLTEIDLSGFITQNVTNMDNMFADCRNLTNIDLSDFNTNNVTSMEKMFEGCRKLTNIDLSMFYTKNVINMESMFNSCGNLVKIDMSGFNTQNVINMTGMFNGCKKLKFVKVNNEMSKQRIKMEFKNN